MIIGAAPRSVKRACIFGSRSAALIALLSVSMISGGVVRRRADRVPDRDVVAGDELRGVGHIRQHVGMRNAGDARARAACRP